MASIEFLNVDLDLESKEDLSLIVHEFGDRVVVLNNEKKDGVHKLSFELAGLMGSAEYLSEQYLSLVNKLSDKAKGLWCGCQKIEFDFGFESGNDRGGAREELSNIVIKTLSDMNASVAVTIYRDPG